MGETQAELLPAPLCPVICPRVSSHGPEVPGLTPLCHGACMHPSPAPGDPAVTPEQSQLQAESTGVSPCGCEGGTWKPALGSDASVSPALGHKPLKGTVGVAPVSGAVAQERPPGTAPCRLRCPPTPLPSPCPPLPWLQMGPYGPAAANRTGHEQEPPPGAGHTETVTPHRPRRP